MTDHGIRKRFLLLLAVCCLLALPVASHSEQPEPDRGAWRTAAPAPMKRTEVAVAALGGRLYMVGGFETPGLRNVLNLAITPALEVYDPSTDRWTAKAPMPAGLHHVGIGVAGGRLYVIGGYKQSGFTIWSPVATVYAYDPATDVWTERAAMPTGRGALSVTESDGRLYAIGGYDRTANSAAVEVYDPVRNSWASLAPLPTPRDHLAAATVSGTLYANGGRVNGDYHHNLAVTERYDPATARWTRVANLPTARSGITAAAVDGRIYVFGGGPTPGGSFSDLNEVFTPPALPP